MGYKSPQTSLTAQIEGVAGPLTGKHGGGIWLRWLAYCATVWRRRRVGYAGKAWANRCTRSGVLVLPLLGSQGVSWVYACYVGAGKRRVQHWYSVIVAVQGCPFGTSYMSEWP